MFAILTAKLYTCVRSIYSLRFALCVGLKSKKREYETAVFRTEDFCAYVPSEGKNSPTCS